MINYINDMLSASIFFLLFFVAIFLSYFIKEDLFTRAESEGILNRKKTEVTMQSL